MKNKIVLITGATSGIGKETAIGLAKLGATVVFTARDEKRGEEIREDIMASSGNKNVDFLYCDLSSLASVKKCCDEFKAKYDSLHVLINNAGVWDFKRKESKDGIENVFAVNYLAPFLMTILLLDILKRSAPSRIINVTSRLHFGRINFEDIELKRSFSEQKAYSQSKLAQILFTKILARKLSGTGVSVNCVHPGFVSTNLGRDANLVTRTVFRIFGKSPEKGAETSIYVASSPDVENITGEYFADKKVKQSSKESNDMKTAEKLWAVSEEYVKGFL